MKPCVLLSIIFFSLSACKKQTIESEPMRFVKSKLMDHSGNSSYISFEYNSNGYVSKIFVSKGTDPAALLADIQYSGTDIFIKPVRIINDAVETDEVIQVTTDTYGKPLMRIEFNYQEFKEPTNIPQKDFRRDTSIYEYDGLGLLTKVTGHYHDSTWFNPGTVQTFNLDGRYETNYTNSAGHLEQIRRIANEESRVIHASQIFLSERSIEENYQFEYDQSYINKTDFAQAILLREFNILFDKFYPLAEAYHEVPNRILASKITRDENGDLLSSDASDSKIIISHNSNGYISSMKFIAAQETRKEIFYNK